MVTRTLEIEREREHTNTLALISVPANQDVSYSGPLDRAVAAESKAGLAVDVLRVADVGAIVALIDGHVYPCSFGVRLRMQKKRMNKHGDVSGNKLPLLSLVKRNLRLSVSVYTYLNSVISRP